MIRKSWFSLVAVVLMASACTHTPPNTTLSPIGKTAVYGRQFIAGGNGVLTGLDLLGSQGVLSRATVSKVLAGMKPVGDAAVELSNALKALADAKSADAKASALTQVKAVLAKLKTDIDGVTSPITDPKEKATVSATLATLQALLDDFGNALSSGLLSSNDLEVVATDFGDVLTQWRMNWETAHGQAW